MTLWFAYPMLCVIAAGLYLSGRCWAILTSSPARPRILDGVIFAITQIVVVSQILGFFGHLYAGTLTAVHGAIGIAAAGIIRLHFQRRESMSGSPETRAAVRNDTGKFIRFAGWLPFIAGLATVISATAIAPGGTDVWTYHLSFPAEWHIWHDLRCSVQPTGDPGPPFYPHHSGLIAHLLMTVLHSDILAKFHQIPFWIAGLFGLYRIARFLKCSREAAWFSAAMVGIMPLTAEWVGNAFADISLAGAMVLLLYSITRIDAESRPMSTATFGMVTGLCIGLKAFGAYYALPLVIWGILRLVKRRRRIALHLIIWMASTAISGGFWHLRNWLYNGNPIFPYTVSLMGHSLFPGLISRAHVSGHGFHQFNFMHEFTASALLQTVGIPGFLLAASALLSPVWIIRHRQFRWICLIPIVLGIQFLFLPYRHHPRFLLPALWLSAPALAMLSDTLGSHRQKKLFIVLCASFFLTPHKMFSPWIVFGIAAVLTGIPSLRKIGAFQAVFPEKGLAIRVIAGFLVLPGLLFPAVSHRYEMNKWEQHDSDPGRIASWLTDINQRIPGLNIAFAGFNLPYPLFGPHICNRVQYLSPDGDPLKSWAGDRNYKGPPGPPNQSAWWRLMDQADIQMFVLGTLPGQPLIPEYFWLRSTDRFTLAYFTGSYQCWVRTDVFPDIL